MNGKDIAEYSYLEDLEGNVDAFSFSTSYTFPIPDVSFHLKVNNYAFLDCDTMTTIVYPFVCHDTGISDDNEPTPALLIGELQVNQERRQAATNESPPRIKAVIVDHFVERTDGTKERIDDSQPPVALWVRDHDGVWYRLLLSFLPQYSPIGRDVVRMMSECDLVKELMRNYKIFKISKDFAAADNDRADSTLSGSMESLSTSHGKHWQSSELMSDLLSSPSLLGLANNRHESGDTFCIVESWMLADPDKQLYIKSLLRLSCLEVLLPSLSQADSFNYVYESSTPLLLANRHIVLLAPDPSFRHQLRGLAGILYGSSAYRSPKKVPCGEDFFTMTNFIILHSAMAKEQHCAVHEVCCPTGAAAAFVLRGQLVASTDKGCSKSLLNIAAYVQDYYVDIDYEKGTSKTSKYKLACSYLLKPEICTTWILLAAPHSSYHDLQSPTEQITHGYKWKGETKHDVWRRIADYELLDADTGNLCRAFDVIGGKYKSVLRGNLLPATNSKKGETKPKLRVRLYPVSNSIDFGGESDADDNAGLWVFDASNAWYKLVLPATENYRGISDRDWRIANAIISLRSCLFKLKSDGEDDVIQECSCSNSDKDVLNCSLYRFWQASGESFDLATVKADRHVLEEHMDAYICFHESKAFISSFSESFEEAALSKQDKGKVRRHKKNGEHSADAEDCAGRPSDLHKRQSSAFGASDNVGIVVQQQTKNIKALKPSQSAAHEDSVTMMDFAAESQNSNAFDNGNDVLGDLLLDPSWLSVPTQETALHSTVGHRDTKRDESGASAKDDSEFPRAYSSRGKKRRIWDDDDSVDGVAFTTSSQAPLSLSSADPLQIQVTTSPGSTELASVSTDLEETVESAVTRKSFKRKDRKPIATATRMKSFVSREG